MHRCRRLPAMAKAEYYHGPQAWSARPRDTRNEACMKSRVASAQIHGKDI